MFRDILVPVDLEDPGAASRAIAIARRFAEDQAARLCLLSILPPRAGDDEEEDEEEGGARSARAREALAALLAGRGSGPPAEPLVRLGGSVSGRIIETVETRGSDLVVIASHNPSITDYLIGSNAAHVAVHAPCSVLVVRGSGPPRFASILVPVNPELPETAARPLALAEEIAARDRARVTAVAVQPLVVDREGSRPVDIRPRLEAFLAEHARGPRPELIIRLGGSVSGEIRDVAEEIGADLIVMGSRGPHFTDSLIGSNAAHVALHAPVSVMVVR